MASLYDKYFETPEKLIVYENARLDRGVDSLEKNIGLLIVELNKQFKGEKYTDAFSTMDSLGKLNPDHKFIENKDFNLAKGLLYLLTDQPHKAVDAFNEANKNMVWDDVQWYMALAFIKIEKLKEAEIILEKLKQREQPRI